ncbi:MAG: TonB-dependent receptor, partial [Pseudomonadota bacterium]
VYFFADREMTAFWSLEFDFNYTENDKTNVDSSPRFIQADFTVVGAPGTAEESQVSIEPRKTEGKGETSRYNLKNTFLFGDAFGFDHQIVLSASYEDFSTESTSFRGDRRVHFDISTGEYFTPDMRPVNPNDQEIVIGDNIIFGLRDNGSATREDFDETGVNLLDFITFNEHWAWLIGGRYSKYQDKLNDFDDDDISYRTGVVYTHHDDLSFYVSYSEGYTNSAGRVQENGDSIDPETSTAWELGSKWQPNDELLLTATVYRIQKQDLGFLVNPEAPPGERFYTNVGEVQSQGLELEAVGFITPQWRIQAGYSYVDSEVKEGGVGEFNATFPEGNAFPGVPENSFNVFTFYEFDLGQGVLGLGGGLYYVDEVFLSLENRGKYDDWYQLDLGAYYKQDGWKIQLNVDNTTDEDYRLAQAAIDTDSFAATRVGTSVPRRYILSFAYEI